MLSNRRAGVDVRILSIKKERKNGEAGNPGFESSTESMHYKVTWRPYGPPADLKQGCFQLAKSILCAGFQRTIAK